MLRINLANNSPVSIFFYVSFLSIFLYSIILEKENNHCPRDSESVLKDTHNVYPDGTGDRIYNKSSPILFIGGVPKSGTTLMRVLLDIHPSIRCGPESHVIIDVLKLRYEWANFGHLKKRNDAAGITNKIIDKAVSAFILEVVARHGEQADIICDKEPFLMTQGGFLATSFPNSKVIHMVRDGRAVSHSLVSRNLEFPPFSKTDHRQNLKSWSNLATGMNNICEKIGLEKCRTVRYEDLILDTEVEMRTILTWLDLPWTPDILRHHEMLETVKTSKMETTADQIVKPLYKEAVDKWKGNIPQEILDDNMKYGPALRQFGYALFD